MPRTALTDRQKQFVEHVHQLADAHKALGALQYANATPSDLHSQLHRIDAALTKALQGLLPLDLRHREGQDLAIEPFNWPVVQAIQQRLIATEITRWNGQPPANFMSAAYPTELIDGIRSLRDAARSEAEYLKPKQGNSAKRNPRAAALAKLGEKFVFHYKIWFRQLPRISKTGWVVDVLNEALDRAGLEGADASDVLRRAVEKDVGRRPTRAKQARPAPDDGPNAVSTTPLRPRPRS